jgi:hypothetical protein
LIVEGRSKRVGGQHIGKCFGGWFLLRASLTAAVGAACARGGTAKAGAAISATDAAAGISAGGCAASGSAGSIITGAGFGAGWCDHAIYQRNECGGGAGADTMQRDAARFHFQCGLSVAQRVSAGFIETGAVEIAEQAGDILRGRVGAGQRAIGREGHRRHRTLSTRCASRSVSGTGRPTGSVAAIRTPAVRQRT